MDNINRSWAHKVTRGAPKPFVPRHDLRRLFRRQYHGALYNAS